MARTAHNTTIFNHGHGDQTRERPASSGDEDNRNVIPATTVQNLEDRLSLLSSSISSAISPVGTATTAPAAGCGRLVAADHETDNTTARALLTKQGFDPDNLNKKDGMGHTPLIHFCWKGNLTMVRYLIFIRGVDWREIDGNGRFPLYWAAMAGHLKIIRLLFDECGAHEDVRRVSNNYTSPFDEAFYYGHFHIVPWLILNGALTSLLRRRTSSRIHTYTMRRALFFDQFLDYDKRLRLVAWAQAAVAAHEQFQVSSFIPLVELRGNSDVLEIIAGYCVYCKRHWTDSCADIG